MDKKRLRIAYVRPQVEVYCCDLQRVITASAGGGAGSVDPDPGGDIEAKGWGRLDLSGTPSFGGSHTDLWDEE